MTLVAGVDSSTQSVKVTIRDADTGEELLHDPKVIDLYLGTLVKAR